MNLNKVQRFSGTPTKLGYISISQPPKLNLSQSTTNKTSQIYKNSPYARPNSRSKSSPQKQEPSPARIRRATPTIKKNSSSSMIQTQIPIQKRTASHSNLPILQDSLDSYTTPSVKHNKQGHSVNLSFNNSFKIPSRGNDSKGSPKIQSRQSTASTEIQYLEGKLSQKLRELSHNDRLKTAGRLTVYKEIFQDIINKDTIYGTLLTRIQSAYDEALSDRNSGLHNPTDLLAKVDDLTKKLTSCNESKRAVEKKLEKVLKENQVLNVKLDEKESKCEDLHNKLYKISQTELAGVEINEENWKFIVAENKGYADLCQRMKADLKNYKYKEKKLLKLVLALKKRGYPVEDVYDQDVQRKKKEMPRYEGTDLPEDNSENEQLVSGRPKDVKRPQIIPVLKLEEIQQETISSSSSSSYSDSESSHSSNA